MSVSSILAFVLLGARASTGPGDRPEEKPNRPSYAELKRRVAELEDDVARANVQARLDQELIDLWRERALSVPPAIRPEWRQQQIAQALQAQAYQAYQQQALHNQGLAHHNAQLAMNAQNFYAQAPFGQAQLGQAQPMGLLGAQSLNAELWCNCVPSRSQVWATSAPE